MRYRRKPPWDPPAKPRAGNLASLREARDRHRTPRIVAQHDLGAEPAARRAGAPGVGEKRALLDRHPGKRLPHLGRLSRHVRRSGGRRGSVLAFERAESSGRKIDVRKAGPVRMPSLHVDQVDQPRIRVHAARDDLGKRAEHQRVHVVPRNVPPAGRRGRERIEDATRRTGDRDRDDRAVVVRKIRHGHALDRIACHCRGVTQRHVDSGVDRRIGSGKIDASLSASDLDRAREPDRRSRGPSISSALR